jgi:hypothetical protein
MIFQHDEFPEVGNVALGMTAWVIGLLHPPGAVQPQGASRSSLLPAGKRKPLWHSVQYSGFLWGNSGRAGQRWFRN